MALYAAYGSNLCLEQMVARCPSAEPIIAGEITGHRLGFCGWSHRWGGGVATIIPGRRTDRAPCLLWEVGNDDLRRLDAFEGAPRVYVRTVVRVAARDGRAVRALSYTHLRPTATPPSPEYLRTILGGYVDWGLDLARIARAVEKSEQCRT